LLFVVKSSLDVVFDPGLTSLSCWREAEQDASKNELSFFD